MPSTWNLKTFGETSQGGSMTQKGFCRVGGCVGDLVYFLKCSEEVSSCLYVWLIFKIGSRGSCSELYFIYFTCIFIHESFMKFSEWVKYNWLAGKGAPISHTYLTYLFQPELKLDYFTLSWIVSFNLQRY